MPITPEAHVVCKGVIVQWTLIALDHLRHETYVTSGDVKHFRQTCLFDRLGTYKSQQLWSVG